MHGDLTHNAGVAGTPQTQQIAMYRTLIAAAAFAVISLGTVNASSAQGFSLPALNGTDQVALAAPGDDVHGQPTGEEKEGQDVQSQERAWVWINACWSRWYFVGYNWWGRPVYRRYVSCY
jgi:hypothetical protein